MLNMNELEKNEIAFFRKEAEGTGGDFRPF
jgi:hypothetical protein